jgi:taurine dioxygenase
LDRLFAHVTEDRFVIRHKWSVGDVAIWDNRVTLHYPLNDYHRFRREMLRVSIAGEVPA